MSIARWAALAAVLSVTACGGSGGPELHPVSGSLLFDGQPADGATVVFHQAGTGPNTPKPSAVAGPDGGFTLRTYPHGDGAPAGEYVVLVTWLQDGTGKDGESKNRLPNRYADIAQSGLKATVKPGSNKLEPFQLTKKAR